MEVDLTCLNMISLQISMLSKLQDVSTPEAQGQLQDPFRQASICVAAVDTAEVEGREKHLWRRVSMAFWLPKRQRSEEPSQAKASSGQPIMDHLSQYSFSDSQLVLGSNRQQGDSFQAFRSLKWKVIRAPSVRQ